MTPLLRPVYVRELELLAAVAAGALEGTARPGVPAESAEKFSNHSAAHNVARGNERDLEGDDSLPVWSPSPVLSPAAASMLRPLPYHGWL